MFYFQKAIFGEDNLYENVKIQLNLNALNTVRYDCNYNNLMGKLYIYEGVEKSNKEKLFKSILGIKYFEKYGKLYYFVGAKDKGINQKVPRGCLIREVVGRKEEFEEIVKLLEVEFVKNGQYTVVPFIYKYLNEILSSEYRSKKNKN
ncbi:MAG: hypothetical protein ACRCWG_04055 [Sarcina sp.]